MLVITIINIYHLTALMELFLGNTYNLSLAQHLSVVILLL